MMDCRYAPCCRSFKLGSNGSVLNCGIVAYVSAAILVASWRTIEALGSWQVPIAQREISILRLLAVRALAFKTHLLLGYSAEEGSDEMT